MHMSFVITDLTRTHYASQNVNRVVVGAVISSKNVTFFFYLSFLLELPISSHNTPCIM